MAVVYEHISCERRAVHLHTIFLPCKPNKRANRKTLDVISVVSQRRNRPAESDSDHNYHEYIPRNWTIRDLSLGRKESSIERTLPTGCAEISPRLAADVIARHVRANEIEVNAARDHNPKKKNHLCMSETTRLLLASESNDGGPSRGDISKGTNRFNKRDRLFGRFSLRQSFRSKNITYPTRFLKTRYLNN